MAYEQRLPVRFEDVDYARVVYFPRLFGYCHQTFEDFFGRELGRSYAEVIEQQKVGFPVVQANADFQAPLRFGETCRVVMEIAELGQRSITSQFRLYRGDSDVLCAQVRLVSATIAMEGFKSIPIPQDIRETLARHLVDSKTSSSQR